MDPASWTAGRTQGTERQRKDGPSSAQPCPTPAQAGLPQAPPPARRPGTLDGPLTLAMRIMRLATSRSPWWFWPISAMMKHGCCPPTQRPGHSSSSSGMAAARASAPHHPSRSRRRRRRRRHRPLVVSVSSPARPTHRPRHVSPRPLRSQSSSAASLQTANQIRGRSHPLEERCGGKRKPSALLGSWACGSQPEA